MRNTMVEDRRSTCRATGSALESIFFPPIDCAKVTVGSSSCDDLGDSGSVKVLTFGDMFQ